jgi:methylmalonyl-CoA epimerase
MKSQFRIDTRFHHVGIVVKNISEATEKYATIFGLDKTKIEVTEMSYMTGSGETEEFKYVFIPLAEGENNFLELVQPITPGPTSRYLEKHGEGLFHLAFETSEIEKTTEQFRRAGVSQAGATPTKDVLSVFFHPKQANGVLIQVLKKGIFNSSGKISASIVENETNS